MKSKLARVEWLIDGLELTANDAGKLGPFDIVGKLKAAQDAGKTAREIGGETVDLLREIIDEIEELKNGR